jgi:hypothetical protein
MAMTFKEMANALEANRGGSIGWSNQFVVESNDPEAVAANFAAALADPTKYNIRAKLVSEKYVVLSVDFTERKDTYVSFSTSGGTTHINQSYGTRARYAAPGGPAAPDYQGAIGVDGSTVNGVDVTVPAFNFAIRKRFPFVDNAYLATVASLTGSVNAGPFGPHAAGEVLFLGADGGEDDQDWVEIAYQFSVRPNQTGLSFGPITGVAKFGWDYVWVRHGEKLVGDSILVEPIAAYVEQVYPAGNFNLLGL